MEPDPFASISQLCHVSSFQEDRLRRCRFAHETQENDHDDDEEREDGSEYYKDAPPGIVMVSPPDSLTPDDLNDASTPQFTDIFQTPPEDPFLASSEDPTGFVEEGTVGGCSEGGKTVDLGLDTDLGFSEVELTQRIDSEIEVTDCELDRVRDLKRELATNECLSDSQLKKRKTLNLEPPNQCLEAELEESRDQTHSNRGSPYNYGSKSVQNDKICETFGESDGVIGFSEGIESYIRIGGGCNNGDAKKSRNLGRKSIEDIDKYRYVDSSANSLSEMKKTKQMRTLPVSVLGQLETAGIELDSGKNHREITLLDVLRMLAEKSGYDRSLENKSILDVAKSRGMTFP